jgi:ribonuclease-3
MTIKRIEQNIGYTFRDKKLLELALTHKSANKQHNERLEFLGDAILSSIITAEIFTRFTEKNEGVLSRMRSSLIQKDKLIAVASAQQLASHIRLSASEKKRHDIAGSSIIADALEALIGAIFLDSDWITCASVVKGWYINDLDNMGAAYQDKDAKTKLQEYMQAMTLPIPTYTLEKTEGQEHNQTFYICCQVTGITFTTQGSGRTRKKAEQDAASQFLKRLQTSETP